MDFNYCYKECPIGTVAVKEFLEKNGSVFDAVSDFREFTVACFKVCPYKEVHTKETVK